MSTAVGGVDVCVATPIHDPYVGLDLEPASIPSRDRPLPPSSAVDTASGTAATSAHQQPAGVPLRTGPEGTRTGGALSNPVTLYKLAKAALSNMILSDNLTSPDTMVSLALTLRGIDLSKVLFVQYHHPAQPGGHQPPHRRRAARAGPQRRATNRCRDETQRLVTRGGATKQSPDNAAPSEAARAPSSTDPDAPSSPPDGSQASPRALHQRPLRSPRRSRPDSSRSHLLERVRLGTREAKARLNSRSATETLRAALTGDRQTHAHPNPRHRPAPVGRARVILAMDCEL